MAALVASARTLRRFVRASSARMRGVEVGELCSVPSCLSSWADDWPAEILVGLLSNPHRHGPMNRAIIAPLQDGSERQVSNSGRSIRRVAVDKSKLPRAELHSGCEDRPTRGTASGAIQPTQPFVFSLLTSDKSMLCYGNSLRAGVDLSTM